MAEGCSSIQKILQLCSPCGIEKISKEASCFCIQCKSYFCDECLKWHGKFPAMKEHSVLKTDDLPQDISNLGQKEKDAHLETNECHFHPGSKLEIFCEDHQAILCTTCQEKHGKCKTMPIKEYAKGFFKSEIFKDIDSEIGRVQSQVKGLIDSFFQSTRIADKSYMKKCSFESNTFLNKLMRIQVEKSCKDIDHEKETEADAFRASLQMSLERIYTIRRRIDSIHYSDSELFTFMHRVKTDLDLLKEVMTSCRQSLGKPWLISFKSDGATEEALKKMLCYNSTTLMGVDMKQHGEDSCDITTVEVLSDGRYVVGDAENNALKVFNSTNSLILKVLITAAPRQIIELKDNVILMFSEEAKEINAVTILDGMNQTELFCSFEDKITGLANSNGQVVVAFDKYIFILDEEGQLIGKASITKDGNSMFSGIRGMESNKRTGDLYILEASYLEHVGPATDIEVRNRFQSSWSNNAPSSLAIDLYDAVWLCKPGETIKRLTKNLILLQEVMFDSLGLPASIQSPNTNRKCRYSIACNNENGLIYIRASENQLKVIQVR